MPDVSHEYDLLWKEKLYNYQLTYLRSQEIVNLIHRILATWNRTTNALRYIRFPRLWRFSSWSLWVM